MLCADEVSYAGYLADVLVLTPKGYTHEVEVKCAKSDLCNLETKKEKHLHWTIIYPNYFSIAVPTDLVEEAKKVIEALNPKYGLIEIQNYSVVIRKSPKLLHDDLSKLDWWKKKVYFRNSSALLGYMRRIHLFGERKITNE
jgi:hypothetical protein